MKWPLTMTLNFVWFVPLFIRYGSLQFIITVEWLLARMPALVNTWFPCVRLSTELAAMSSCTFKTCKILASCSYMPQTNQKLRSAVITYVGIWSFIYSNGLANVQMVSGPVLIIRLDSLTSQRPRHARLLTVRTQEDHRQAYWEASSTK